MRAGFFSLIIGISKHTSKIEEKGMTPKPISRRRFLWMAGGALGATALTCSGLTLAAFAQPAPPEIKYVDTTYGEKKTMNNKILVTYASQAGSTMSVAEAIAKTLAESGAEVDVRAMKEVDDLTPYRAVVAGSAIHGGKWLPEAMHFLQAKRAELSRMPFAAFMVCITLGRKDADKLRVGVADWMAPVRSQVKPISEGLFAGCLDFSKLPVTGNTLGLRLAVALGALPGGDHRDWNAIRNWANDLAEKIN
jgi:menaquinone-dependent protoporphyrinogen oxidase